MHRFFNSFSFKVVLIAVFLLPIMTRGARKVLQSNDNNVHDWLPPEYNETQEFTWFQRHFENETFVLITWQGCTLADERLELMAQKLVPPKEVVDASGKLPLFKRVETGQRLMKRLTSEPLSLSEDEVCKRLGGLFIGPDRKQTCAVITLTEEGKRDLRATLKELYRLTNEELGLPRHRVRMGGPPVDNVAISVEGERTLIRLFIPAGIVGLSLAWWCLRSVRLTTMVFSAALYAGAVSLAFIWYTHGTMNAILLTMPAVVYVAGISGAIHFANYYRDCVAEKGVDGAPARALQHAWLPCTLSAVTTALGLVSLYTSELVPIKWFGVYSAVGVMATLGLLFVFLPSWMQLWPMKPRSLLDGKTPKPENLSLPVRWRHFLEGVLRYHRWVLAGLVLVMVFCGYGVTKINTSIKLTKLFSSEADIIHDYQWLEEHLGPLVPMEIVVRIDNKKCPLNMLERMQLIERVQARLEGINGMGNNMSAVTFAPSLEVKRTGVLSKSMMASLLNKKLESHREEYLQSGFLAIDGHEELWRISARVGALNDIDYGEFKSDIIAGVEPELTAARGRLARAALKRAQAAAAADNNAMHTVAYEADASHPSPTGRGAEGEGAIIGDNDEGIRATYTGLVPLVYKAQRSMLNGLAWNFVTDLLTVAAVIAIIFFDIAGGLILLLPSVFPMLVVFGIMGWMGVTIDVGTIMTPTVALGVSVDDVVHFLIWYRRGLSEGKSRKESIMLAYEDCARPMYQSWAVLGLGLAVFALSSFVPTQRFGGMMFALLTAALVGNLLLLPTLLASPIGALFGIRLVRKHRKMLAEQSKISAVPRPLGAIPHPATLPHVRRDAGHVSAGR